MLQQDPDSLCGFVPDIASIRGSRDFLYLLCSFAVTNPVRPSFLHLLFQYRRLFRAIAARDFKLNFAPLAIVCWVDIVLAKLGDVAALVAAGLDKDHPDQSLPESLKVQREEDNLRAAIQLPGKSCSAETRMYLTRRR